MTPTRIGALRHGKKRREADKQAQAIRTRKRLLAKARAVWAARAQEVGNLTTAREIEAIWWARGAKVEELMAAARQEMEEVCDVRMVDIGCHPELLIRQKLKYRTMAEAFPPDSPAHRAAKATADLTAQAMQAPPYNCTITPPAEQEAHNTRLTKAVNWIRGLASPQAGG